MARKVFLYFFLYFLFFTTQVFAVPAFPGAEGFGFNTIGGRGGKVYEVTNLNDSGAGSLRECINASGPRICIFKVGGVILVQTTLNIANPFITIAGQTATGTGIMLRIGPNTSGDPVLDISTHDVIVRYLTVRAGAWRETDAMNAGPGNGQLNSYNVIIDHCSLSWGVDQIFATWYRPFDMSFQWNIYSEGLDCATHSKGCHSKGPMIGSTCSSETKTSPGAYNMSFHHNLTVSSTERTPLVKTAGIADIVNNLTYNSKSAFSHVDMEYQLVRTPVNYVGNYFKAGPSSNSGIYGVKVANVGSYGADIYVKGNIGPMRTSDSQPETNFVDSGARGYVISSPITIPSSAAITTTSAFDAYNQVLGQAGNSQGLDANGNWFFRRDGVDKRVVNEVKSGKGKIIDAPWANSCLGACRGAGYYLTINDYNYPDISLSEIDQSDGYPVYLSGTPYTDSDHDGMPDSWENRYGFNPGSSTDGPSDADGDGYTNLEEFLNATNPISTPTPTVILCARKGEGDANCDGVINILDFETWRREFLGIDTTTKADFDGVGGVSILDFEIWRRGMLLFK